MNDIPAHLIMLMKLSPLAKVTRLGDEDRICIEFATRLRELTVKRKLHAVWEHIPNEGKRSLVAALILRAMGLIAGAGDYSFSWGTGSGFIEFKASEKRKQTTYQIAFEEWCKEEGVKYSVCHTADEGIAVLEKWGVITW